MRLGLKLDAGYWNDESYQRLFGQVDACAELRRLGVEAVETPLRAATDPAVLAEYIGRCRDAGLIVSLHPYSELTPHNPEFFEPVEANPCRRLHERFLRLAADLARRQDAETVVNIHPAASDLAKADTPGSGRDAPGWLAVERSAAARRALVERSIDFFRWARRWCEAVEPRLRVVAELQIASLGRPSLVRIGDRYEELSDVIDEAEVGACWDFGHATMNHRRHGWPLDPPETWLRRVAHVHCHDIDADDHQSLQFGVVPWERFLRRLAGAGFVGTVVLEVPPQSFLRAGGMDTLARSIEQLRYVIDDLSGR